MEWNRFKYEVKGNDDRSEFRSNVAIYDHVKLSRRDFAVYGNKLTSKWAGFLEIITNR